MKQGDVVLGLAILAAAGSARAQFAVRPVLSPLAGLPTSPALSGVQAAIPLMSAPSIPVPTLTTAAGLVPSAPFPAPPVSEERAGADFAAKASADLAVLAEDLGLERGLKFSGATGQDFLDLLRDAQGRYALRTETQAAAPEARASAFAVQRSVLRVVAAMIKPAEPLMPQLRRILPVWSVFNDALKEAAEKGASRAVEDEARLFAEQVERSV